MSPVRFFQTLAAVLLKAISLFLSYGPKTFVNLISHRFFALTDVNYRWRRLTNALSGQFCASLNFLDSERTSQPEWILGPMGVDPPQTVNGTARRHLRFGTLPGENVCTENLTPWKKLLPCGGKRGIGSLLNARYVFV